MAIESINIHFSRVGVRTTLTMTIKMNTARTKVLVNSVQAIAGSIASGIDTIAVSKNIRTRFISVGRAVSRPSIIN